MFLIIFFIVKLIEFAKDSEIIKANDLKQSLNLEKSKYIDLMDKLNQEKKKSNHYNEQLFEANEQISNLKERLCIESKNHSKVCKDLELERNNNEYYKKIKELERQFFELEKVANNLDSLLIQEKSKNEDLSKAYYELREQHVSKNLKGNNFIINLAKKRLTLERQALKLSNEIEFSKMKHKSSNVCLNTLNEILKELEDIDDDSNKQNITISNKNNNEDVKLIEQNKELIKMIKQLGHEKSEYKQMIIKLEEKIWLQQNKLNSGETFGISDYDKEKFRKIYLKYLRAESFRKSLIYQKKFLLIMLSGYEETEREILSTLKIDSNMLYSNNEIMKSSYHNQENGIPTIYNYCKTSNFYSNRFLINKPKNRFRSLAFCIIAVKRIKYIY